MTAEPKHLKGRAAIITGVTRGVGRVTALELVRRGANVAFNYAQSAEAAAELNSKIEVPGILSA